MIPIRGFRELVARLAGRAGRIGRALSADALVVMASSALILSHAIAQPTVVSTTLVASSRVNRTHFNYTYALQVVGDSINYASFQVTSSTPSTVVIKPKVSVGNMDAAVALRTSVTFVIQQDRTQPFDNLKLSFKFSGTTLTSASGARIGAMQFLESAGELKKAA